jgi:hypothetical protein
MNKRKLVRIMALPAAAVFVLALVALLSKQPIDKMLEERHIARLDMHVAILTQEQQTFLTKTAARIGAAGESGRNRVIAEIQSELLREQQLVRHAKKYIWMSDARGEFVFGLPAPAFAKLNDNFDKNIEIIRQDGHYKDRNDYLMRLIHEHENLNFAEQERATEETSWRTGEIRAWRFYADQNDSRFGESYTRPVTMVLSAPVLDQAGAVEGNLFLKLDDSANGTKFYSRYYAVSSSLYHWLVEPVAIFFAFVAGFFLWFLLPSWVYIDAQQRGVSNPAVWAFLALVSLVFGLAIYLITRPATLKSHTCPKCEKDLNGGGAFCPYCGYDLAGSFCAQCQYPIKQEWSYCPSCRAELGQRNTLAAAANIASPHESARPQLTAAES